MTRFKDASSHYLNKFSDFVSDKVKRFKKWAGLERKKYFLNKWLDYVVDNLKSKGKTYGEYVLFEFLPFVAAYGLILNIPVNVLLGMALTVETVVSWGLVFYIVSEEFTSIANDLKPYIRVSAKVDN